MRKCTFDRKKAIAMKRARYTSAQIAEKLGTRAGTIRAFFSKLRHGKAKIE